MPSRAARLSELSRLWARLHNDVRHPDLLEDRLPDAWRGIEAAPRGPVSKVTLRVDGDVARFYRSLGPGHQAVMNRVLRGFMLSKLTEVTGTMDGHLPTRLMAPDERARAEDAELRAKVEEMLGRIGEG
ncbi:MAG: BrnA antitoxin family protein [Paracoccaceae bacterium]